MKRCLKLSRFAMGGAAIGMSLLQPVFARADAESDIRAANAAEVSAILSGDQARLGALWADGFVVTNPFNTFVHKPQVMALMTSGVFRFSALERTIEYIHDYGDFAVVAGAETGVWAGKSPMTGKQSHFRFTAVWRHDAGGWVEIARHANIVPPAPPAAPL